MAYDPHTLVTFGGTLSEISSQDEIWQCGIRGGNPADSDGPVDPGQLQNFLDVLSDLTDGIPSWFSATGNYHPTSAHLTWIKVANIGADGHYTADPVEWHGDVSGAISNPTVPSFMSVACSFRTEAFGRRNRNGRIYPPNFGAPVVGGTATIASQVQTNLATQTRSLIGTMNTQAAEYQWRAGVFSAQGGHSFITSVRVGNVYDYQSRRKNAVQENYVTQNI